MILLNTKYCSKKIVFIKDIQDIKQTNPNEIIHFSFNEDMCLYAKKNKLEYMVDASSIKECILANHLEARYILLNKKDTQAIKEIMNIAQNYLFDSKIICAINDLEEINELAKTNIDGVYLKDD